jgi:ryanodine receptor 2
MSWQHYLYSKLGSKKPSPAIAGVADTGKKNANHQAILDELVERIVAMAKVLFGLHMV